MMNVQNNTTNNIVEGGCLEVPKDMGPNKTFGNGMSENCDISEILNQELGDKQGGSIDRLLCNIKKMLLKEFPSLASKPEKGGEIGQPNCPKPKATSEEVTPKETKVDCNQSSCETSSSYEAEKPDVATTETAMSGDCEIKRNPGKRSYQAVIRDLVEPGSDGKIGEKELQDGLARFALYQVDKNALNVYKKAYSSAEGSNKVETALTAVRDRGLLSAQDADWVNSYTRFASEFDRETSEDGKRISVSLSNSERYNFEDAITWAEANLAYVVGGTFDVENVSLPTTDAYIKLMNDNS